MLTPLPDPDGQEPQLTREGTMEKDGYGQIIVKGFVQAIPWAIVFSIAWVLLLGVTMNMLRQEVKEAVEYAAETGVSQSIHALLTNPEFDRDLWPKIKQNTKEAIEYTVMVSERKHAGPRK